MKFVLIFWAVLLQDCIRDAQPGEHLGESEESSNWVDSLIKHIKEATNIKQVTLISNLRKQSSQAASPIIGKLFVKICEQFPTLRLNSAMFNESQRTNRIEDETFFDSSTTIFFFVQHSSEKFDALPSLKTVDALLDISTSKLRSQFLVILVSQTLSQSLEKFLTHAWDRQLIDFTIIELVETRTLGIAIQAEYEVGTPIIHQFHPFKKEYTRTNWTSDTKWFPDKVLDMWGYPLKIGVLHRPPFTVATFDDYMEPVSVGGANIILLKTIAKEMNFSLKYLSDIDRTPEMTSCGDPICFFNLMQSGKVDILAYTSPHYSENMKNNSLRTTTIRLDQLCTVIPILPTTAMPLSLGSFETYVVSFGIVIAFWIFSHIVRFRTAFWGLFNIVRILLGVSTHRESSRISERTLYTFLLLVSAIFSSTIYATITGITLQKNAEMELQSFRDLDESGLTPLINVYIFNKTYGHSDNVMIKLKEKTIKKYGGIATSCPVAAVKYRNISCLLLRDESRMAVKSTTRRGIPKLKATGPCFWTDSTAFLLGKGSPYRSHINDVITILKDTGLMDKFYDDGIHNTVQHHSHDGDYDENEDKGLDNKLNMKSLRRQIYSLTTIGYTISTLVFIGEIAIDWILRFRRLN